MSILESRLKKVNSHTTVKIENVGEVHNVMSYKLNGTTHYFMGVHALYKALKGPEECIAENACTLEQVQKAYVDSFDPKVNVKDLGTTLLNYENGVTGVTAHIRQTYFRYHWINHEGEVQEDNRHLSIVYKIWVNGNPKHPAQNIELYAYTFEQAEDILAHHVQIATERPGYLLPAEEDAEDYANHVEGMSLDDLGGFAQGQLY